MHGTYGNGSDTCYERGAATAKMEVITKGGDGFYVQNKFLTKLKTDLKKSAHSQKLAINERRFTRMVQQLCTKKEA